MAIGMWRRTVGRLGLDLGDGGRPLLNLRFADDILTVATAYIDAGVVFDELHYIWQKICCNHCCQQPAFLSFDRRVEPSKSCVLKCLVRKERAILLASVLSRKPLTSPR